MTIKVILNSSNNGIVVRPSFATPSNPSSQLVLKNQAITNPARIDTLGDVIEGDNPADGSTLVYNPATDKYEVQRLNLTDVDGSLDGGEF